MATDWGTPVDEATEEWGKPIDASRVSSSVSPELMRNVAQYPQSFQQSPEAAMARGGGNGAKPQDTSSVLSSLGKTGLGMVKSIAPMMRAGAFPTEAYSQVVKPQIPLMEQAGQDIENLNAKPWKEGVDPLQVAQAVSHGGQAILPVGGPMASDVEQSAMAGRQNEAIGKGLGYSALLAGPKILEGAEYAPKALGKIQDFRAASSEAAIPEQEAGFIKRFKEGVKGGKAVEENIDRAKPYVAEVGRSNPKNMADIHAGIDAQRDRVGTALQEQAGRHPEIRVSGDDVAASIRSTAKSVDAKLFPKVIEQIEDEAARYDGNELTAPEALEAAATLRAMKESYFNAAPADKAGAERASGAIRGIDAAHDEIVDKLAERMEATGEKGVKEQRADYGALRNITDATYKAKVREGQTPAPSLGGSVIKAYSRRGWAPAMGALELLRGEPLGAAAMAAYPAMEGIGRYFYERGNTPTALALKGARGLGKLPSGLPDYTPTPPQIRGLLPAPQPTLGPGGMGPTGFNPEGMWGPEPIPPAIGFEPGTRALRTGRLLGNGATPQSEVRSPRGEVAPPVGPVAQPPSPFQPAYGSEPTPTGGARGFPTTAQPIFKGMPGREISYPKTPPGMLVQTPGYMRTNRMLPAGRPTIDVGESGLPGSEKGEGLAVRPGGAIIRIPPAAPPTIAPPPEAPPITRELPAVSTGAPLQEGTLPNGKVVTVSGIRGGLASVTDEQGHQGVVPVEQIKPTQELGKALGKPVEPPAAAPAAIPEPVQPKTGGEAPSSEPIGMRQYIEAKKNPGGFYQLFYRGTRNEIFPGEKFNSANEARSYWDAQNAKKEAANVPTKQVAEPPKVEAQAGEAPTTSFKWPWEMTKDEFNNQPHNPRDARFIGDQFHREAVQEAYDAGKPVPPEVLDEYGLKPPTPKPAEASEAPAPVAEAPKPVVAPEPEAKKGAVEPIRAPNAIQQKTPTSLERLRPISGGERDVNIAVGDTVQLPNGKRGEVVNFTSSRKGYLSQNDMVVVQTPDGMRQTVHYGNLMEPQPIGADIKPNELEEYRAKTDKAKPSPRTGLTKLQSDYLSGKLQDISSSLPNRGKGGPVTDVRIKVPNDGDFVISDKVQASTLNKQITGKPLEGIEAAKGRSAPPASRSALQIASQGKSASASDYQRALDMYGTHEKAVERLTDQLNTVKANPEEFPDVNVYQLERNIENLREFGGKVKDAIEANGSVSAALDDARKVAGTRHAYSNRYNRSDIDEADEMVRELERRAETEGVSTEKKIIKPRGKK